jgi:ubiquinone/menaquinone biosynthesis C-methylase UbiE
MTTIEYLDAQAESPFWKEARKATVDSLGLQHGATALDVGCGTGEDTRHMAAAAGSAVGVDADGRLVEEAIGRTGPEYDARFERATPDDLPFPDHSFSAVRADRALQHADDLGAAIAELWRVTKPGGRIVLLEPDWDTFVIDAGPLAATRAVTRAFADSVNNPAAGRQAARRLRKLGALEVQIEPRTAALTDFAAAEQQYRLTDLATSTLAGAAARGWLGTLRERDEQGAFLAAVTYFLVSAVKPAA